MASENDKGVGIYNALLKVQGELKPIARNSDNPFHKSRYADLAAVSTAVLPLLTKHGILVVQTPGTVIAGDHPAVVINTQLIHAESGTKLFGDLEMPLVSRKAQEVGSAITYARRYALMAMVGAVAEGEDDDGNEASKGAPAAAPVRKPAPQKQASSSGNPDPDDWLTLRSLLAEWRAVGESDLDRNDVLAVATKYAKAGKITKATVVAQIAALRAYFNDANNPKPEVLSAAQVAAGELEIDGKAA